MRRLLQISGVTFVALIVLLFLVVAPPRFAAPLVQPVRMLVVSLATAAASRALNGSLEIEALEGSLLSAPVARGVRLKDARGEPVALVDSLSLRYRPGRLFKGQLHVQELVIDRPEVSLAWDDGGRLNLAEIFAPDPDAPQHETRLPVSIEVESASVESGVVLLAHPAVPGVEKIDQLSLQVGVALAGGESHLKLHRGGARAMPADVTLETLRGNLAMEAGRIQLEDLLVQTLGSRISAAGSISGDGLPTALQVDLRRLDMAEIGGLLGEPLFQGDLQGSLQLKGAGDSIELDGRIAAGQGEIRISGGVDTRDSEAEYKGILEVRRLDLSRLMAREALASDLNATLQVQGTGQSPDNLTGDLALLIGASRLGEVAIGPSEVRVSAESGRIRVQDFSIQVAGLTAVVQGDVDLAGSSTLDYRIDVQLDKLREIVDAEVLSGRGVLKGRVGGTWPDTFLEGRLEITDGAFDDARVGEVDLYYRVDDFRQGPAFEAALEARAIRMGDVDIASLTGDTEYRIGGDQHQAVFAAQLVQSSSVRAQLEGSYNADGQSTELVLDEVNANLGDHVWANTVPLRATIYPDGFRIDPFRLEHGDGSIEGAGGLQDGQFEQLVLRADNVDLDVLSRAAALPILASSRVDLSADLAGTLDTPVLNTQVVLRRQGGPDQQTPFEKAALQLRYARDRVEGDASLRQAGREVLAAGVELPVRLALTALPIEERLVEGPLAAHLDIARPDLEALSAAMPNIPALAGTLEGRVAATGSLSSLALDTTAEFDGLGVVGVLEEIRGSLGIKGGLDTAPSLDALRRALADGSPELTVSALEVQSPRISAALPTGQGSLPLALADLVLDAGGRWYAGELTGDVRTFSAKAEAGDYPVADLALIADFNDGGLRVEALSLSTQASQLRGEGGLALDDGQVNFAWEIPTLDLREFLRDLPPDFPSLVSGGLDIAGSLQAPEFATRWQYAGAEFAGDGRLDLAPGGVPGYQAQARLSQLDIARFDPGLAGQLGLSVEMEGRGFTADELAASIEAAIESTNLALAPELAGTLRAEVSGRSLDVETLQLASAAFDVRAEGVLSATHSSNFDYRMTLRDLSSLNVLLSGDLAARGTLAGNVVGNDGKLRNVTRLRLDEWRFADWSGGALQADLEVKDLLGTPGGTASAEMTGVQGPPLAATTLKLDGTYRSGKSEFSLAVEDGPWAQSLIAGDLSILDGIQGTLPVLRLQHDDQVWQNGGPIRITSDAAGAITVSGLHVANAEQRIDAEASWSPDGNIRGQARIGGLQISPLLAAFSSGKVGIEGVVNADLRVRGTLAQPRVDGTLAASALRWQESDLGGIEANVSTSGTVLNGAARWTGPNETWLTLDGRLNTQAPYALEAEARAPDLDLAVIQPFSPEVLHSAGRLRLDLALSGTLSQPRAQGSLELRDAELQLATLGETFRGIQTRLAFNGRRVDIERFQADSATGSANLEGWMDTDGLSLTQVDLKLSTDTFTVVDTRSYTAVATTDIAVRGSSQDLMVEGTLDIVRARLRYEALPSTGEPGVEPWELTVEGVFGPGPPEAVETAQHANVISAPDLPFLRTDVQIRVPGNSWVQGTGTAVEIGGDISVTKALGDPVVVAGEVRAVRGFATFFGRRFIVEKGLVTFTGSKEIDPILDVEASHRVSGHTAYVHITGTVSKPEVRFRSDPELEESDIISLLVFGRTSDQLSSSEQSALGRQTARLAGRLAADALERHVGDALGLDTIAVDLGGDTEATSLGVGRYVGQDLFLFYERTFRDPRRGNRSGNSIGIEKRLNERQSLKATGSDLGETAVDWSWRYDY